MDHKICEVLDKAAGKKSTPCNDQCKNWVKAFEHNRKACCLSEVLSVEKGKPCYIFEDKDSPST